MKTREVERRKEMFSRSDSVSIEERKVVFDTVYVVTNETVWYKPDSVGRQYPLKTVRRESGGQRVSVSESVYQARDTVYVATTDVRVADSESRTKDSSYQWVPWVILIGIVVIAVIVIVVRIFL